MSAFRAGLFTGKTAVVTGGATGIGYAISAELRSLGARVLIASRNEVKLREASEKLNVDYYVANIRKEEEVAALINAAQQKFGDPVDLLVNNGGGQFPSKAEDITSKGWSAVLETNLTGAFLCSREFKRARSERGLHGGAIVNITCDYHNGFPGMAHTGSARAGTSNAGSSA